MQSTLPRYFMCDPVRRTLERWSFGFFYACKYADTDMTCSYGFLSQYFTCNRFIPHPLRQIVLIELRLFLRSTRWHGGLLVIKMFSPLREQLIHVSLHFRPSKCLPFSLAYLLASKPIRFEIALGGPPHYNDIILFCIVFPNYSRVFLSCAWSRTSGLSKYKCLQQCRNTVREKFLHILDNPAMNTFRPIHPSSFHGP